MNPKDNAGLAAADNDTTVAHADQLPHDATELKRHARHLATYAASINWQPGDNTREWLLGLRDLIEHVQAITEPNDGEMPSDLDLSHLDDGSSYLWERCYACGHRLRFASDGCPQCGIHFDGRNDPERWPENCSCERCLNAQGQS